MTRQLNLRVQQGFTLIELVIVLVLLGILVAVAVPKYADLTTDAEDAAGAAAAGAVNSAFSIATAVTQGTPTPAEVTAQMTGATLVGNNFEVVFANGTRKAQIPAQFDSTADCASPSSTVSTYVCSIDVGSQTVVNAP